MVFLESPCRPLFLSIRQNLGWSCPSIVSIEAVEAEILISKNWLILVWTQTEVSYRQDIYHAKASKGTNHITMRSIVGILKTLLQHLQFQEPDVGRRLARSRRQDILPWSVPPAPLARPSVADFTRELHSNRIPRKDLCQLKNKESTGAAKLTKSGFLKVELYFPKAICYLRSSVNNCCFSFLQRIV